VRGTDVVGTCAFKSRPVDGRAEIAYFTLPAFEGQGVATGMARLLIQIALQAEPGVQVIARTLPEPNASNHLLGKLGFQFAGAVQDPEDGTVWEWHLPR
jgi:RimJ/RimL family protein N-acetyltransferase